MSWFKSIFSIARPARKINQISEQREIVVAQDTIAQADPVENMFKKINPLDLMKVTYKESPNKSAREDAIEYIVLHHTGPGSFNGILNWLCNPDAKASAHYLVGANGELTQMVNSTKKAWHAGVSKWYNKSDLNKYSIGIEICNIGRMEKMDDGFYYEVGRELKKYTGPVSPVYGTVTYPSGKILEGYYVPYPQVQLEKIVALCKALVLKYPAITKGNIISHYDIGQPEGRKNDPFGLDIDMIRNWVFENS